MIPFRGMRVSRYRPTTPLTDRISDVTLLGKAGKILHELVAAVEQLRPRLLRK